MTVAAEDRLEGGEGGRRGTGQDESHAVPTALRPGGRR
jgi:hypothetical protein